MERPEQQAWYTPGNLDFSPENLSRLPSYHRVISPRVINEESGDTGQWQIIVPFDHSAQSVTKKTAANQWTRFQVSGFCLLH